MTRMCNLYLIYGIPVTKKEVSKTVRKRVCVCKLTDEQALKNYCCDCGRAIETSEELIFEEKSVIGKMVFIPAHYEATKGFCGLLVGTVKESEDSFAKPELELTEELKKETKKTLESLNLDTKEINLCAVVYEHED